MKDMKRRMQAVTIALLALVASACASGGGGIKPPPPPPPPPPIVAVNFVVHDFISPGTMVPDVVIACGTASAATNADGWATLQVPNQHQECTFNKDGYHQTVIGIVPGTEDPISGSITAIPPPTPEHPVSANARQGRLRLDGGGFLDDSGRVNPLWAHHGDGFSIFVRDEAKALGQLDETAKAGYQGIRVWGVLGCGPNTGAGCSHGQFWRGREVGPTITADYWLKVRRYAEAIKARGMRMVWSQGDIGQLTDRRDYMARLAQVDNELGGAIDIIDCGNEAWQTGEPDANALARCVGYYAEAGGQALKTLTSPPGEGKAEIDQYSIPPADLFDVHTFRDNHWYDKIRHILSIRLEGKPRLPFGIGSEPPGNGARVSASANKHELDDEAVPLLALASILARQSFVWFSGEGVIIDNGLNGEAGFWTTPRAVGWLPKDVMAWPLLHHGGDTWRNERVVGALDEGRVDCRQDGGGRFACVVYGPSGTYPFPVYKNFTGRVCNPGDGVCEDVSGQAGGRLTLTFRRGRYLEGRVH